MFSVGPDERPDVPIARAKREIAARMEARPDATIRMGLHQPPVRHILARVDEVTGYGWRPFEPAALSNPVVVGPAGAPVTLDNGLVSVTVDDVSGTFSLDGRPGYGRLVDGGDLGDSYNYSPPRQDRLIDSPTAVSVRVVESGPVRARVAVTATYTWPDHIEPRAQERVGEQAVDVETILELRADEPAVRVATSFVNPSRDHRLRVHFPLPEPARSSRADCAFAVVERGLTAEGRTDEFGLPTAPAHRFVSAGGLTVVHDGVCEYELVDTAANPDGDTAATVALTVLRSTGMLSRPGMAYRPLPAGPTTPVEGLQMTGRRVSLDYALALDVDDPYSLADDILLPLEVVTSLGGGSRPSSGSALTVEGAEVSAVRRAGGTLEVRVFNPGPDATTVVIPGESGWSVDLRGYPLDPFEGSFSLRPYGFATVRLHDGRRPRAICGCPVHPVGRCSSQVVASVPGCAPASAPIAR